MKKVLILCLIAIIILSGCSANISTNKNSDVSVNTNYLSFLDGKNIIEIEAIGESAVTPELESLFPKSEAIVLAKVLDITYKAIPGTGGAWTVADIDIIKSYKGNFETGDKINIYYPGGYISVEDHIKLHNNAFRYEDMTEEEKKNTYFHEIIDGESLDPVGKTYLLCLVPTLEGSPLPEGSYERISAYSQMEYIEKNKTFVQPLYDISKKANNVYNENEIINAIELYK